VPTLLPAASEFMEHSIPFLFNQPIYLELMQIRLAAHVENLL